ncbi:MAG: hypothetical protein ACLS5Z_11990 [Clostridium fessum]
MMNILNGGAHAANTVDVQEFDYAGWRGELLRGTPLVYGCSMRWQHCLKSADWQLVGDEGGFAPDLEVTKKQSSAS